MDSIIQKDQYRHYLLPNAITFAASYALGLLLNYLCTGGINVMDPGKGFLWAVQIFPAMMLAVLCGSPVAMGIEFILLIFCTIKGNATTYYMTTPVLIASIISFLPVRKRWYLSKKGTLRAILVQLLATSAALGITDSVNIGYVPNLHSHTGAQLPLLQLRAGQGAFVFLQRHILHKRPPRTRRHPPEENGTAQLPGQENPAAHPGGNLGNHHFRLLFKY